MSDFSDPGSDYYDSDGSAMEGTNDSDIQDEPIIDTVKHTSRDVEHQSLSITQLKEVVDSDISRVASIIGLETSIVSVLLRHFNWNSERLFEQFLEDAERVLENAGEPVSSDDSATLTLRPAKRVRLESPCPPSSEFVCSICFDDSPPAVFRLRCAHSFCSPCWKMYVTSKIKEEGQSLFTCMHEGCRTIVDAPSIARLTEPNVNERFKELVLQSYVSAHAHLRFCPHPGCTETVLCHSGKGSALFTEVPTVNCGQRHSFCFGCGLDSDHRPIICKLVQRWFKTAREDSGTSQWIKANTRTCPKCVNNIEKNGGCNRILCRQCNYEFCWLCMKHWDVHGYNNEVCNAWKEPDPDDVKTEARQSLEKWLFYFDRFNNHEISACLDAELCTRTEENMVKWQEQSQLSWIESTFMRDAVNELTACRQTLKWTYAMAFFLAAGNEKQIFEDIQADLERAVEDLSQLLEEPVDAASVKTLRQRMLNKTVYVRGRHELVLHDTAERLADGRWEWNEPLD